MACSTGTWALLASETELKHHTFPAAGSAQEVQGPRGWLAGVPQAIPLAPSTLSSGLPWSQHQRPQVSPPTPEKQERACFCLSPSPFSDTWGVSPGRALEVSACSSPEVEGLAWLPYGAAPWTTTGAFAEPWRGSSRL